VIRYLALDRFELTKTREDVSKYFLDAAAALALFADDSDQEDGESDDDVSSVDERLSM